MPATCKIIRNMVCTTSFYLEDRNTLQAFRKNFVNILSTFQFQESTLKRLSFYNNHHPEKGMSRLPNWNWITSRLFLQYLCYHDRNSDRNLTDQSHLQDSVCIRSMKDALMNILDYDSDGVNTVFNTTAFNTTEYSGLPKTKQSTFSCKLHHLIFYVIWYNLSAPYFIYIFIISSSISFFRSTQKQPDRQYALPEHTVTDIW